LNKIATLDDAVSDNSKRIFALQDEYIKTIDAVIRFLQGKSNLGFKSVKKIICLKLLVLHNWKNSIGLLEPWEHRIKPSTYLYTSKISLILSWNVDDNLVSAGMRNV
jgi:hypothetical protein